MFLNTLSPEQGSKSAKKRLGRGIGSGLGKTSGRGHKGQKARSGGYHKINFEGGQMPLQRRLPKTGFSSRICKYVDEVTLHELSLCNSDVVTIDILKLNGIVNKHIREVKVVLSGEIHKPITVNGLRVTKGARSAIESAGGKVEE